MAADRKIIALDIGGVCCSIHPERLIARLNRAPTPDFLEKCRQVETSQMTEDEFLDMFDDYTGRRFSRCELIDLWNLCLGPSIPGMADAVRSVLKRGYSFAYLSDTSTVHIREFFRRNDFCHLSLGGVFSFEVGAMKPDERMYREFERRFGVPVVYFDDRIANIEGARKLGWNAVHFRSAEDFTRFFDCLR